MDPKKITKPLILLIALIIFCSIFARTCFDSETLAEYAAKNPKTENTETGSAEENNKDNESDENNAIKDGKNSSNGQSANNKDNTTQDNDAGDTNSYSNPGDSGDHWGNSINKDKNQAGTPPNNNIGTEGNEVKDMAADPNRVEYKQGFYYEPLSEDMKKRITGISYPVTEDNKASLAIEAINIVPSADSIQISYDELQYVSVLYNNFKGITRTGELICNKAIAQDLVEIFYELYESGYQIEQIALIDEYGGDDTLSMLDNNTSCFNYRMVDGTTSLSKHALGLAIDINPFFNPYVVYKSDGTTYISPQGSEIYADRSKEFAFKIDENDLCYKLFMKHGFVWGGNWNSSKDYQHFQKVPE